MPIHIKGTVLRLSQQEFGEIVYHTMGEIFDIHREFGYLFDETVYKKVLADRLNDAQSEVEIEVTWRDFSKSYFMDVVVSQGAVFELKAVEALKGSHERQLLHYLLLSDIQHGKLVNIRPGRVEHKFVNTALTYAKRVQFQTESSAWVPTPGFGMAEKSLVEEMVRDWGTALNRSLYEEAIVHFLGGPEAVFGCTSVKRDGTAIAQQSVLLCAPETALKVTTFNDDTEAFLNVLERYVQHTDLQALQWINIGLKTIRFTTVK